MAWRPLSIPRDWTALLMWSPGGVYLAGVFDQKPKQPPASGPLSPGVKLLKETHPFEVWMRVYRMGAASLENPEAPLPQTGYEKCFPKFRNQWPMADYLTDFLT
jgi:hypothetical protein